ncbi:MAG: hypothetical protein ACK4JC_04370 [Silanimonas lenta]
MRADSLVRPALLAALCLLGAGRAQAGDWQYRAAPYLWGTAIDGGLRHRGLDLEVRPRASFGEVFDSLDAAAMGAFEASRDGRGWLVDVLHAEVSPRVGVPVPGTGLAFPVDVHARSTTLLLAGHWRWREGDWGYLDAVAGLRHFSTRTRFRYELPGAIAGALPIPPAYAGAQSERWVDVQLGLKGRRQFGNGLFLGGWALAGAGGAKHTTDLMLHLGGPISAGLAWMLGYRWLDTRKEAGGFRFDARLHGPGLGLEWRW